MINFTSREFINVIPLLVSNKPQSLQRGITYFILPFLRYLVTIKKHMGQGIQEWTKNNCGRQPLKKSYA